jgi:hypothetical protein
MRAPDAGTPQREPQPATIGEMRGDSQNPTAELAAGGDGRGSGLGGA